MIFTVKVKLKRQPKPGEFPPTEIRVDGPANQEEAERHVAKTSPELEVIPAAPAAAPVEPAPESQAQARPVIPNH